MISRIEIPRTEFLENVEIHVKGTSNTTNEQFDQFGFEANC